MATDAKGLVLMKRENNILGQELGSYEVQEGLELVFKAYVEDQKVKLFLTTSREVSDEEFNEVYDAYDFEPYDNEGFEVEEVEEEYNPVWCIQLAYDEDHDSMADDLNYIINCHKKQMETILGI